VYIIEEKFDEKILYQKAPKLRNYARKTGGKRKRNDEDDDSFANENLSEFESDGSSESEESSELEESPESEELPESEDSSESGY